MGDYEEYDELFFRILHKEGQIKGFLNAIFSFLSRRTDFFKIQKAGSDGDIGLPPGAAEGLVRTAFCKYFHKAQRMDKSVNVVEEVPLDDVTIEVSSTIPEVEEVVVKTEPSAEPTVPCSNLEPNEEKVYRSDPECYNGAVYENYSWSQSIKDIDVLLKVPDDIISGKQVKVSLLQQKLKVDVLHDGNWQMIVDGDLRWTINVEESIWTLVPHKHIHVCVEKTKERWWDSFFVTEPKIDVQHIDSSQSYTDLDEEAQAKIRELMFNEQQKRLGKPTIEQAKIAEVLQDAWDREDSPFRGQPFDPNIVCAPSSDGTFIPSLPK